MPKAWIARRGVSPMSGNFDWQHARTPVLLHHLEAFRLVGRLDPRVQDMPTRKAGCEECGDPWLGEDDLSVSVLQPSGDATLLEVITVEVCSGSVPTAIEL